MLTLQTIYIFILSFNFIYDVRTLVLFFCAFCLKPYTRRFAVLPSSQFAVFISEWRHEHYSWVTSFNKINNMYICSVPYQQTKSYRLGVCLFFPQSGKANAEFASYRRVLTSFKNDEICVYLDNFDHKRASRFFETFPSNYKMIVISV